MAPRNGNRAFLELVSGSMLAAVVFVFVCGCEPPPDLWAGISRTDTLDGSDLDEYDLGFDHGISVAQLEEMLGVAKGGVRIISNAGRRYIVYRMRLENEERVAVHVTSIEFDPIVAITSSDGVVLGVNNDLAETIEAEVVVQNPFQNPMNLLVIVTDFGTPTGGSFSIEARRE